MATELQRDLTASSQSSRSTAIVRVDDPPVRSIAVGGDRSRFGDRTVLDGVDLTVRAGEFVAMLGRSGTGKSTLLRILGGLDPEFDRHRRRARSRASFVFQEPRLLPWKRVVDNVRLGLRATPTGAPPRQALDRGRPRRPPPAPGRRPCPAARRSASPWPAPWCANRSCCCSTSRSARSTRSTRIKMHALLQELCRRHRPAVLLVTHDVDEAILLADRVVVLDDGHVTVDVDVALPAPRLRGDHAFGRPAHASCSPPSESTNAGESDAERSTAHP